VGLSVSGTNTVTAVAPPTLSSIAVNGGALQRSQVKSLTVTYDQTVNLAAGAVTLVRLNSGGSGANDNSPPTNASTALAAPTSNDGGKTWVYTFAPGSAFMQTSGGNPTGSLVDGIYTVTVDPTKVTSTGSGLPMLIGGSQTFHRLFGDGNGDKNVNNADLGPFRNTFGRAVGDPAFNDVFDFDNSTAVNNVDFGQFRNRYGHGFTY
jgi:hypothetical protein